jgi:glycosyltransferase involved in cell wall biosynthesis
MNDHADPFEHRKYSKYSTMVAPCNESISVVFLVGSTAISGGTFVILQHALALKNLGWKVTLACQMVDHGTDTWHAALGELRIINIDEIGEQVFDVAVATWWRTVLDLRRVNARQYVYFVQSIESRFYAGDPILTSIVELVNETYKLDLLVITIAAWIQICLYAEYRTPSLLVRNGIRKDIFTSVGPQVAPMLTDGIRVLVEGTIGVPMKNVDSAVRLARAGGATEVWLVSGNSEYSYHSVDRVFSAVRVEDMAMIYRSCDVLLKLSRVEGMYGPPLEMFHCGGTVVTYDVSGFEEYVVDGENGIVVLMDDEAAVIEAIRRLACDRALLNRLKHGAMLTATQWMGWEKSSNEFIGYLASIANLPERDYSLMRRRSAELADRLR